jgi:hypothetical protein
MLPDNRTDSLKYTYFLEFDSVITFETANPAALLQEIRKQISAGRIATWRYDTAGDFTHKTSQWDGKIWLRPSSSNGALTFSVVPGNENPTSRETYGIFHGRFLETVTIHVSGHFTEAVSSSSPAGNDQINSAA